jgi:SAM-dependent methyltransferase
MTTDMPLAVEQRLTDLLQHLGLAKVHVAARTPRDWQGFVLTAPERIASLTLVCPQTLDGPALRALTARCLLVTGDHGPAFERVHGLLATLTAVTHMALPDYSGLIWDDVIGDHLTTIRTALLTFLQRMDQEQQLPAVALPEHTGEHAGLFYRIHGAGPPLVLLPLGLAPSQWEPLLPTLAAHYCTITLGGPVLGTVATLEERSRTGYLPVVQRLVEEMAPQPGETILEVGCGSGVLTRWIARRTAGRNRLVGLDVNPYILREARGIARHEQLDEVLSFQDGNAETLPFPDQRFDCTLSCTMLEEVDAERAIAELVRVTTPGGRVGIIVRALDMPWWVNLPVEAPLKSLLEASSRLGAGVQAAGCADASLYQRLKAAGLAHIRMFPQWAVYTEGSYMQTQRSKLLVNLSPSDTQRCRTALAQAEADGTFLMAEPFHCAVGTKR